MPRVAPAAGLQLTAAIVVESGTELGEFEPVEARGYWEQVWRRFRRDKVAIVSGLFVVLLVAAAAVDGPIAQHFLGHGPSGLFFDGVNEDLLPVGPMTHVYDALHNKETILILGADGTLGRDEFLRLLYGPRVSLEVAILSTLTTMTIGTLLGSIAGFYRGWTDTVVSGVIEVTMAFPYLLFVIALAATIGDRLNNVTFGFFDRGVLTLLFVFTLFGWFYPRGSCARRC
jgi:peptide/nickel transport system permease protein